jgi:hypothetical protein
MKFKKPNKKYLREKQLKEKRIQEDKKFFKRLIIGFGSLLLLLGIILVFVTYWCDSKYYYRKTMLYGKEIKEKLICMNGNALAYHETIKFSVNRKVFYACGEGCRKTITNHYDSIAFAADAFSGDTICKSNAIVGLAERGDSRVIYFKSIQNFDKYYQTEKRK